MILHINSKIYYFIITSSVIILLTQIINNVKNLIFIHKFLLILFTHKKEL